MSDSLKLAISTCPNDTFAFHAILNNRIEMDGLEFEVELLDISQLNAGLLANRFDVAKASFHAAVRLANQTVVLPSGSAIGFGVGPLLLASIPNTRPDKNSSSRPTLTICPGELTTATMLLKLFYGSAINSGQTRVAFRIFSEIMPALQSQSADFGVCIHEGRFTWQQAGLHLVEDLGTRWETETGSPLPLGGILARRDLPAGTINKVQRVIRRSIEYGLEHPDETLPTMRSHAQEFNDDVLQQHVALYVNEWTVELGDVGRNALKLLAKKSIECGLSEPGSLSLEVWSG